MVKENTAAVVFFVMDVSGSMDKNKKYLARSFYFLLYQFLRYRYDKIEVVFISHSTDAHEVDEDSFFQKATSGGTIMSSALELEEEIITKRYHPSSWNIYTFYCGDGENWNTDNDKTLKLLSELVPKNQMVCYAEITPFMADDSSLNFSYDPSRDYNSLWSRLNTNKVEKLHKVRITNQKEIYKKLKIYKLKLY